MNDLSTFQANMLETLKADLSVKTWEDFKRRFLLGAGNSQNTTRAYLCACKQFYDFSGELHPMQCDAAMVEAFYDQLPPDLDTRAQRIAGLKFMYRMISERYPTYQTPFDLMPEKLQAKLRRTKKDESERDALTETEYKDLLTFLRRDISLKGKQNYAIVRFLETSGMRISEACALRWENIAEVEGKLKATFIGKGAKRRTIWLEVAAVKAARSAYRARWGHKPEPTDFVFHGLPTGPGIKPGITPGAIGIRIRQIAEAAKAEGILRANLHVSPHTFRHTCCTLLLAAGVPVTEVQRHLGHSNIATTMIYAHAKCRDLTDYFVA